MVRAESLAAAARFLVYYDRVRQSHEDATGSPLREYKATEPDRLAEVFEALWDRTETGAEILAEVLHRLVWSQCLGNANHRTSVLFLQSFLDSCGVRLPDFQGTADADARWRDAVNHYSDRSHRILDRQSEFGYGPRQLEVEHRRLTAAWLTPLLAGQSRVVATIGAQRLMNFSS